MSSHVHMLACSAGVNQDKCRSRATVSAHLSADEVSILNGQQLQGLQGEAKGVCIIAVTQLNHCFHCTQSTETFLLHRTNNNSSPVNWVWRHGCLHGPVNWVWTHGCLHSPVNWVWRHGCLHGPVDLVWRHGCLHSPGNWVWRHGCLHGPVDSVRRHGCLHGPVDSVQRQCLSALQTCSYAHHKTDNVRCTRFQLTDNDVTDVSTKGQLKHLTRWIPSNAEEWHRCQHCRPASADYKMNHFGHTSFGQLTTMAQMPPLENDSSTLHNQSNQLSLYGNAQTYNVIKQLEIFLLPNWARKDRTITDQVPADWPWWHGCQLKWNTGHGTVAAIKPSFSAARDN